MSGAGAPAISNSAAGLKIYVLVTSWHQLITDGLLAGAERELAASGADNYEVHRVPGAFELPLAAKWACEQGADAVVALGVVIQGETPHFDYVCDAATSGLTRVQLDYGVPVGFGLLTVDTEQQGIDRAGLPGSKEDKGAEAVQAAVAMARLELG